MNMIALNNKAWDIFQYSDDKGELEKALVWIDQAMHVEDAKPDAHEMDTRANLLYKLGRAREAIEVESKAVELSPESKTLVETLKKMEQGVPTWVAK